MFHCQRENNITVYHQTRVFYNIILPYTSAYKGLICKHWMVEIYSIPLEHWLVLSPFSFHSHFILLQWPKIRTLLIIWLNMTLLDFDVFYTYTNFISRKVTLHRKWRAVSTITKMSTQIGLSKENNSILKIGLSKKMKEIVWDSIAR